MRIPKATWVTTSALIVAVLVSVLLRNGARGATETAGDRPPVAQIDAATLQRRALPGELRVGGFLRALADVTISAERAGRVVALPVAEGGAVKAGQIVASLEDTTAAANLAQARAAAREAGLDPDLGAAELERARASLSRAEHEFSLHHPASPIDGVVEVHHVDVGEYVVPGTPLVDVLDMTRLILDVDLDPEIAALEFEATVNGKRARISRVANRADPHTRRFRVELEVEPGMLPGMYVEASLRLPPGPSAFYVPKSAARDLRGETGVFVVREGRAVWVPLRVAEVHYRPALWRVVEGALRDGDTLVVSGFSGLRDGMDVEVLR